MDAAPYIMTWQKGLSEAAEKIGRRFDVAVNLEKWLKAANFGDVVQHVSTVPTQQWPKNKRMKMIGAYQQQNMLDATSSYGQAHFTRVLGWSVEEYAVLGAKVRGQLKDSKLQLYSDLYVPPYLAAWRDCDACTNSNHLSGIPSMAANHSARPRNHWTEKNQLWGVLAIESQITIHQ